MVLSRRELCIVGAGVPLLAGSSLTGAPPGRATPRGYRSSLVGGITPKRIDWDGRRWSADMGSTWNPGMGHSFQAGPSSARFEIRPTALDRASGDPPHKRRSELHCTKDRLPNGVALWGAMTFNHHPWADPASMAKLGGGVHGQVHMGKFGGSPALAFRRMRDGRFLITTRGEFDDGNNRRWAGQLSFGQPHDLVYRLLLDPVAGELDVWVDGRRLVQLRNASIGSRVGGCYWCLGCYYAGGISGPIVAEFANHQFPSTRDLAPRIKKRPAWIL